MGGSGPTGRRRGLKKQRTTVFSGHVFVFIAVKTVNIPTVIFYFAVDNRTQKLHAVCMRMIRLRYMRPRIP